MVQESFRDIEQRSGDGPKELHSSETVVKDVFSLEYQRGIAFYEQSEANRALGELQDGSPFDKIIVDHTQQPPLHILTPFVSAPEEAIAKKLGKERGYESSYVGIALNLDPTTYNLHIDFDTILSTLRQAGISTNLSGKDLINHFERMIKHRASIYEIEDEDNKRDEYAKYEDGGRGHILLAKQDGLDVYLLLGLEAEQRLISFKHGDNLDISGTTLSLPLFFHDNLQASNETKRIEFGTILSAIDIDIIPSSKAGKIDGSLPNFDPGILSAGRDLTARITKAFEALKPKA